MNSLRANRTKRRTVGKYFLAVLLFFLLFPYLISLIKKGGKEEVVAAEYISDTWIEADRLWGKERIPLEEYLVGMMAATVPLDYEEETLKAQAVMLRSWCYSLAKKQQGVDMIPAAGLEGIWLSEDQLRRVWGENYEANRETIQKILKETEGMVLIRQEQIIAPPFFRLSNGNTRAVEEYQTHVEKWAYLQSLSCPQDVESEEYLSRVEVPKKKFEKKVGELLEVSSWKLDKIILHRDRTDYVKVVEISGKRIPGEEFRHAFGLASSCFTLEKQNDIIVIKTRGIGHGFGFSQYQANELAKQGQTYRQLLEYFFSEISIERF
ncbi:MAG: SpoIID/LytB domain-containing protein [Lachnospiraceae bacterium]|nr:SpoIID/LytB domain-containing protein [Lachnospiraceae bacterium]